jgi:hypothetical protein
LLNALAKSILKSVSLKCHYDCSASIKIPNRKNPHNEQANLHLLIGQVLRQSGRVDSSILHLEEAIQAAPDRLEPYLELGLARKERRNINKPFRF